MLAALTSSAELPHLVWGGLIGLILAFAIAWVRYGKAVDLGCFLRVTARFMAIFAIQLMVYALHEFTESGLISGIDNAWWHAATVRDAYCLAGHSPLARPQSQSQSSQPSAE